MEKLKLVLEEIKQERARQDEKWGVQNHPDISVTLEGFDAESVAGRDAEAATWIAQQGAGP